MTERELLEKLVKELGTYNAGDMLEGYLDPLGKDFNKDLMELGIKPIELYIPITASYSSRRKEIQVFDAYDDQMLFSLQEGIPHDAYAYEDDDLAKWVMEDHFDTVKSMLEAKGHWDI